jgi:hypothetical protein
MRQPTADQVFPCSALNPTIIHPRSDKKSSSSRASNGALGEQPSAFSPRGWRQSGENEQCGPACTGRRMRAKRASPSRAAESSCGDIGSVPTEWFAISTMKREPLGFCASPTVRMCIADPTAFLAFTWAPVYVLPPGRETDWKSVSVAFCLCYLNTAAAGGAGLGLLEMEMGRNYE